MKKIIYYTIILVTTINTSIIYTQYRHPAFKQNRGSRKIIEKRKKKKQKTKQTSGVEIEIKTEMDSKTISEIVKQASNERDISKKIELIKEALLKYSISTKSKPTGAIKISYKIGNKIMWMILGIIRNASRYKPKEIKVLTSFLKEAVSDGSIETLPNARFWKKVPEYINSLEIKFTLKMLKTQKEFSGKTYWLTQVVGKVSDETKFMDKNKIFFEIKRLTDSVKTEKEKLALKTLFNALKEKSKLFSKSQQEYLDKLMSSG